MFSLTSYCLPVLMLTRSSSGRTKRGLGAKIPSKNVMGWKYASAPSIKDENPYISFVKISKLWSNFPYNWLKYCIFGPLNIKTFSKGGGGIRHLPRTVVRSSFHPLPAENIFLRLCLRAPFLANHYFYIC